MKILILGGTRYIGKYLVKQLLAEGHEVTVVTRGNNRPDWFEQVRFIKADRYDYSDISIKLTGLNFDTVVDFLAFQKDDVMGIHDKLKELTSHYIFISSTSVYRDVCPDCMEPVTEDVLDHQLVQYDFPKGFNLYGIGKRHCEKWLLDESQIPFTILRFPGVVGEDDHHKRIWWWIQRIRDGGPVIIPSTYQDDFMFIYIHDLINGLMKLVNRTGQNSIYHFAMQERLNVDLWMELLARSCEMKPHYSFVPDSDIVNSLGEYHIPLYGYRPYLFDTEKAVKDLHFQTTPVKEWVKKSVNWYLLHSPENSAGYEKRSLELQIYDRMLKRRKN